MQNDTIEGQAIELADSAQESLGTLTETATRSAVTLEDKAVELIDGAQQGLGALSEKLQELAIQYGPDVVDAALNVARITAAKPLVIGLGLLVLAATVLLISRHLFLTGTSDVAADKKDGAHRGPYDVYNGEYRRDTGLIGFVLGALLLIPVTATWFNIWNWVGLFAPELWIAHRVLGW